MKNTDISIYVPVYNGEKTIEKCVNSILNQTLKPKKILIINDCSSDNTLEILRRYENKINIHNNLKNYGVSYSRNFAVGKVVIVLSQAFTLTLCNPTSITSPSIFKSLSSIQSPSWSNLPPYTWILAISPKIVSLNTNSKIAPSAPTPDNIPQGDKFNA